jgi:uncharacterized protein YdeI (YjbR/CyaY-like superfamily)
MGKKDTRVDAYIDRAAPFAKPILKHLRKIVHAGCPNVEETIKWGFPHFDHKGIMCGVASFKNHCAFGFWKGAMIFGGDKSKERDAMGHFGRITAIKDLPDEETLIEYVRQAAELNATGVKAPPRLEPKKEPIQVPSFLTGALKKNAKARKTFQNFSPTNQREYVEWLTEAKRDQTRAQRLKTAIDWMAQGKVRNWKYLPATN